MKAMPTVEELDRERIDGSIRSWSDKKPGCSDKWLGGILRSAEYDNTSRP